jgi:hypothetical protein
MDFWTVWRIQRKNRSARPCRKIHGWGKMKLLSLLVLIKKILFKPQNISGHFCTLDERIEAEYLNNGVRYKRLNCSFVDFCFLG